MPSFEYKGKDASGENSSGTIDAPSHAAAQATLKSRGITVVLLRPALSGPQIGAPSSSGSYPVPKMGPPSGSFAVPPAVVQAASPAVAPAAWAPNKPGRSRVILLLVALLGALGAAASGYAFTQPQGDVRLRKGETTQVLSFSGRLTFAKTPKRTDPWKNVHVSFVLPEVPTEAILGRTEMAYNAVGDYSVKIHFLSAVVPHILNVHAVCRGYHGESMNNLKIADDTTQTTSIPTITLETAHRRVGRDRDKSIPDSGASGTPTSAPEAAETPHGAADSEPESESAR